MAHLAKEPKVALSVQYPAVVLEVLDEATGESMAVAVWPDACRTLAASLNRCADKVDEAMSIDLGGLLGDPEQHGRPERGADEE